MNQININTCNLYILKPAQKTLIKALKVKQYDYLTSINYQSISLAFKNKDLLSKEKKSR